MKENGGEAFIEKKHNCVHKLTKFFFLLVITYKISYYYTLMNWCFYTKSLMLKSWHAIFL